jgi:cobalt/nickel transport system permease protein
VLIGLGLAAALTGGVVSWFASSRPDGLEWSLDRAGFEEGEAAGGLRAALARVQRTTAILPGYGFHADEGREQAGETAWPAPSGGTSVAGLAGGLIVLSVAGTAGLLIRALRRRSDG